MTSTQHRYSVIIPLYNKGETINRTVESVLFQKHDVEIIIIDDGSTDDGPQKVRDRCDPKIRLIKQPNSGVSAARNRGIEEASNELIALIDADDEWLPGFLDTIDNLVEKYPSAGAYTTSFEIVSEEMMGAVKHPKIIHPFTGVPDYFSCAKEREFFCSSSIVVRREAMNRIGGFRTDMWLLEDNDAWGRLSLRYQIAHSSEPMARYYRVGENHAIYRRSPVRFSFADSVNDYLAKHPEKRNKDLLEYVNHVLYNNSLRNIYSGYPVEARLLLKKRPSNALFGKLILCYLLSFFPVNVSEFIRKILVRIKA